MSSILHWHSALIWNGSPIIQTKQGDSICMYKACHDYDRNCTYIYSQISKLVYFLKKKIQQKEVIINCCITDVNVVL